MRTSNAKIFLADDRGLNQGEWFRSFNTFNFGKYFNESKQSFRDIYLVNDDSLDAGHSLRMLVEEPSYVILLPVMGAICYEGSSGNANLVAAGQAEIIVADKNEVLEISNPFGEGIINFLQVWIRSSGNAKGSHLITYHVNRNLNQLLAIAPADTHGSPLPFALSIGKFEGREETNYQLRDRDSGLFVFVIEGVFEVEGRLLHARDALALWNTEHVELEALSDDAIILLVESPAN